MVTRYISQRRSSLATHASRSTRMHHIAWGIVCVILLTAMSGMWIHSQSLEGQNRELRNLLIAAKTPPTTCKVSGSWKAGISRKLTLKTSNGPRDLLVHMPDNFVNGKYYPLVMFYTGKGSSAVGSQQAFGIDSLPAIVAYPFPSIGKDGLTAWDSAPYASDADDIGFTAAILDKLQADMCIDKTRIYATGFSNGGGFASLLSCKLPGRFAAFAIEAGAFYYPDGKCQPPRAAPVISIHGDNDDIVPYGGVDWRNLPPVYDWTTMRARMEKCSQPSTTYPNITTVVTTWDNCRGNGVVQNVRIIGGQHAWGTVPNDTIWRFLSRFTL